MNVYNMFKWKSIGLYDIINEHTQMFGQNKNADNMVIGAKVIEI